MLKKKINFRKVRRVIVDGRIDKLRKEALNIETGIITRTQKGKDVKQSSFKPYSRQYSRYKQKKGRGKEVNLSYTGAMLQAISSKKITNGLRFYFNASAETKKAFWNQKKRKFFGVDKLQIKYLKKKMGKL